MRVCLLSLYLSCITCLCAGILNAQTQLQLPRGYEAKLLFEETQNPYFFHGYAMGLQPDEIYIALGRRVLRLNGDEPAELVHEFPLGNNAGLLMRPRGRQEIYFSDFRTQELHRIDLRTGFRALMRLPVFTFDIAVSGHGEVIASAFPNFLRSWGRAGIYRIRAASSLPELLFEVDGPSGPIVFDDEGALYYAVQSSIFPSPPGSVKLMRFDQFRLPNFGLGTGDAEIRGGLPIFKGTELVSSLDGAYDLAFDDRGRLYVSDPILGGVKRTHGDSFGFDPQPLLPTNGDSALQLQFISSARGDFAAYQPDFGNQLMLSVTSIGATRVWSIRPARPVLEAIKLPNSGPGSICIDLNGLPPNQQALLWASPKPAGADRKLIDLQGLPFWFALDPASPLLLWQGQTNSLGTMRFEIPYPGSLDLTLNLQGAGLIYQPPFEGALASSNTISIRLKP